MMLSIYQSVLLTGLLATATEEDAVCTEVTGISWQETDFIERKKENLDISVTHSEGGALGWTLARHFFLQSHELDHN